MDDRRHRHTRTSPDADTSTDSTLDKAREHFKFKLLFLLLDDDVKDCRFVVELLARGEVGGRSKGEGFFFFWLCFDFGVRIRGG